MPCDSRRFANHKQAAGTSLLTVEHGQTRLVAARHRVDPEIHLERPGPSSQKNPAGVRCALVASTSTNSPHTKAPERLTRQATWEKAAIQTVGLVPQQSRC